MSDDDIISFAMANGLSHNDRLLRFARAIEAATIERCAAVCDAKYAEWAKHGPGFYRTDYMAAAAVIRALAEGSKT